MDGDDYVLGTHDAEITRLGLQHAVWRPRALDAWRRAGLSRGHRVIDLGCGPGYASLDLADVVGPGGEVVAIDRSARFLAHLQHAARARGVSQIRTHDLDLLGDTAIPGGCDAAWCRWIFAFLPQPEAAVRSLVRAIRPGGVIVLHEYLDYATQRLIPRVPSFDRFVAEVIRSWRQNGGEPNIGAELIPWLEAAGCRIECVQIICDVVDPANFVWCWPAGFLDTNLERLVALGRLDSGDAEAMQRDFAAAAKNSNVRMVTPAVCEIIARTAAG